MTLAHGLEGSPEAAKWLACAAEQGHLEALAQLTATSWASAFIIFYT